MAKRQFVFIMTDSQRWDMLGCYNDIGLKTPNLDRLASEGVRYERAYTTSPVCQPARAGLFIGEYPHSCGGWTNSQAILDNVHTIGQRLNDNGMGNTAYIGKWHLDGGDYFGLGKAPKGWDPDYWYDMRCYLLEHDDEWRQKSRDPKTMEKESVPEDMTFAYGISKRAVKYIEEKKDEDFFLVVSYDEPHYPFMCPEPFASMYYDYEWPKTPANYDNLEGKPEHQKVWAGDRVNWDLNEHKVTHPHYFACNSYVDYEIGKVLDAVREFAPDASVVYTSDHGDFLDEHCLNKKGAAAYDSISHIPLIIKAQGGLKGAVYSDIVSHIGLGPAILEYFDVPVPKCFPGVSLWKTTRDLTFKPAQYIFMEYHRMEVDHDTHGGFQPMRCAMDDRFKLVVNLLSSDELYDLKNDPYETKNLIWDENYAKDRDRLHDQMLNWMNVTRDPFRGYYWEIRPWRKDAKKPTWKGDGYTRQRENEEYEPRQLDYVTGLEMVDAQRPK